MGIPSLSSSAPNNFLANLFRQMQNSIADESLVWEEEKAAYDAAMEEGKQLVECIVDAASANDFAQALKTIAHALTSEKEIGAMAKAKISELGITWDKAAKTWVDKPQPETIEPKEGEAS